MRRLAMLRRGPASRVHTAWMPRSCRSMCMVAASTSY